MTERLEGDKAAEPEQEPEEPGKWLTALQSFVLLVASALAIVYLGDWRFLREPQYAVMEVSLLPSPTAAPAPPPPPKKVVEKKPAPPPKPTAAEIALKKKLEKEAEDKKRREDEEKKRKAKEKKERDKKRREEEKKRKEEEERKKREDEKKRREELELAQRQADAAAAAAARASALAGLRDKYKDRIIGGIERYLQTPPSARGVEDLLVVVEVRLDTDGTLLGLPKVVEPSGVPDYDEAAVRAVLKASPFDMPRDPELVDDFRTLNLSIIPK